MREENSYDFSRKDYEASETAGMVAGGPGNPSERIQTVRFQMGEWGLRYNSDKLKKAL